eukprot:TRINITY_DN19628_c0_g1::TRINITY_DN19628_c0_g1_i1::g.24546::m.24546 TRINITY_DN19628_c0_g1::TRINITY_DN19628_c0_g1_i1::g.24546  ORF type:complete len:242 (+),score=-5.07,sp/Q9FTZ2/EBP_ORYSJ/30.27/1e-18,EBP/PF05241.7/2.7e-36,DUF2781/PF10914.3/1.2e-05 TRINITY_DN19628_c0_g1_i1:100-726(+)
MSSQLEKLEGFFLQPHEWGLVSAVLGGLMLVYYLFLLISAGSDSQTRGKVFSWTVFWLILSGIIHLWIEGMFVFAREGHMFSRMLDQYGVADLRYGNPLETGTAAMEAITAVFDGPFCLMVAYGLIHNRSWWNPLMVIVCTMQLYGLTWFCLHPLFSKDVHFSEDPFLFWVIAVAFNAPWAIFPLILLVKSFNNICGAFNQPNHKKSR